MIRMQLILLWKYLKIIPNSEFALNEVQIYYKR
jgi:hypothetical protein